jgi:dual specificity tyrosine-phosphorylation-regulated kinase 2/3/4
VNGSPILTSQEAQFVYQEELTVFEKSEITIFSEIYTIGSVRREGQQELADKEGYYKAQVGEQIGYRYQVLDIIDKGSFGQVVRAIDYKLKREVAVKLSRNKKPDFQNAKVEVKILQMLRKNDPHNKHCTVVLYDSFPFRKHMVLVFEVLGDNLYKHIKETNFKRMDMDMVKLIAFQVCTAMAQCRRVGVIHCDLKPENLLFVDDKKAKMKVIDFGSSCLNYREGFTYVQSRYYRAPEIVLGLPYN